MRAILTQTICFLLVFFNSGVATPLATVVTPYHQEFAECQSFYEVSIIGEDLKEITGLEQPYYYFAYDSPSTTNAEAVDSAQRILQEVASSKGAEVDFGNYIYRVKEYTTAKDFTCALRNVKG